MQQQHHLQERSPLAFLILAGLVEESKRATALHEAPMQAGGQVIEPGAFSRVMARMEQRGWIVSYEGEEGLHKYHLTDLGMLALQAHERENQERYERGPDVRRGKERTMRLVLWILRLYPPAWRERYEAEMVALLDQHSITLWTMLDLLMGALDARLDPHYRRARQLLPLRRFQSSWRRDKTQSANQRLGRKDSASRTFVFDNIFF